MKKFLKDQGKEFLTTYIDLSEIYGREIGELTEEEVIKEILSAITETLEERNIYHKVKSKLSKHLKRLKLKNYKFEKNNSDILDIPLPIISDNYNKLSKFTMELPQKIIDDDENLKGYIIVIDEFHLLKYLKKPDAFFWLLRSYTQKQHNVSYIFTGSVSQTSEVNKMINGVDGAFGARMTQIPLKPFNKEETREYINTKVTDLKFSEDSFEQFYECTRGIPTYINSLASILPCKCDENDIKEAIELNIDNIALMWLKIWGTISKKEKEIIILLSEEKELSWTEIYKKLKYSKSTTSKYIDLLLNRGIIEYNKNSKYILSDAMLETWLKTKYKNEGQYPI